jgi:hypothetical protein
MYRIPELEVESTVVILDREEKQMIRELGARLNKSQNDVVRGAVRAYYELHDPSERDLERD